MKIWIDLDNTPHVPFFAPVAEELERRGHRVVFTARDAFQVCELADRMGIPYTRIGRHHGRNPLLKVLGVFSRAAQLLPFRLRERPDLALSHGSRAQVLVSNLSRVPTVLITDYEHARSIPLAWPKHLIVPEALEASRLSHEYDSIRFYRGLKEDVYVPRLRPDPSVLRDLGIERAGIIIVVVRPPASEAHYHNPESDVLLVTLMKRLLSADGVVTVLMPRNDRQAAALRAGHPEWFASRRTVVPEHAVDGVNLIWHADLVVSGGGTMNREAAALGVPVYSIFRGELGAIDRLLEREGRLVVLRTAEDVERKLVLRSRQRTREPDRRARPALTDIVDRIEEVGRIEGLLPAAGAMGSS